MNFLSMFCAMQARVANGLNNDDEGQGLAEYALILVFIAIVAIVALQLLGNKVSTTINSVATQL